ncbi:unnamed protein product [Effrenium voratum]|uniref:CCHC-type domain-containing protein n=1 Tax=Effrenium voratum TaxID=2562239 RepID=A0AA36NE41_9DINO|nr:unnamed protein product [Effrenium voratum]
MAEVKCTICGDRGHVASDCKQAAEQHQKENVDWKAEAEKKRELDEEYEKMMRELGLSKPKAKAPPPPPGEPAASPGNLEGAKAAAALLAQEPKAPGLVGHREVQTVPRPPSSCTALVPAGATPKSEAFPRPVGPVKGKGGGKSWGKRPPRPRMVPAQPPRDADVSIGCPRMLAQQLFSSGFRVLQEMGQETGARVTIHERPDHEGGPYFAILGTQEAREMAKMHVRAWLDVNSRAFQPEGLPAAPLAAPLAAPPFQLPEGFPPGFPPPFGGDMPPGFPPGFPVGLPAGFPPGFPAFPPAVPGPVLDARLVQAGSHGMSAEAYDEI